MYILGIWDGHDAGSAIIEDNDIKVAINEERITRTASQHFCKSLFHCEPLALKARVLQLKAEGLRKNVTPGAMQNQCKCAQFGEN